MDLTAFVNLIEKAGIAPGIKVDIASMGVLSWDRDHPETPVVALWNAAPGVPA